MVVLYSYVSLIFVDWLCHMVFLFLRMVGQPASFGLLLLGLLLAIYGPFCIKAYKIAVGCCTLFSSSIITVELLAYRWSRSVHYIWWQRWDPLPASQRQGPLADAATAEGVRKRVVHIARTCSVRAGVIARERTTASKSMGERRLPRGQEDILLPRVRELPGKRRSLGAKVTTRERGALSRPGSLPEIARIAEVARDAEASETCKRSCVSPEGLARRRRGLSLSVKRLFIAVWITGRGVSESS